MRLQGPKRRLKLLQHTVFKLSKEHKETRSRENSQNLRQESTWQIWQWIEKCGDLRIGNHQ
jgi:hypothetical protein